MGACTRWRDIHTEISKSPHSGTFLQYSGERICAVCNVGKVLQRECRGVEQNEILRRRHRAHTRAKERSVLLHAPERSICTTIPQERYRREHPVEFWRCTREAPAGIRACMKSLRRKS